MPLDPTIANPATIKFADPLETYNSFLKAQYLQGEIQKAKQEQGVTNALIEAGKAPGVIGSDGMMNNSLFMNEAARRGAGPQLGKLQLDLSNVSKNQAEAGKFVAQGSEADANTLKSMISNLHESAKTIDTDPVKGLPQYLQKLQEFYGNPLVQKNMPNPMQSYQSDADEAFNAANDGKDAWQRHLLATTEGIGKLMENNTHVVDRGGMGQTVINTPKYGPPSMQEMGTFSSTSKAPVVNVNNLPENKGLSTFNEKMAEDAIKDYSGKRAAAQAAPQQIHDIDTMTGLLNDGALVGALSTPKLDVTRYAKALGFNVPDNTIVESQQLKKMLADNVFKKFTDMKQEGVPMNRLTVAEQKLVQEGSPTMDMDAGTIKTLLSAQRKMAQNAVIMHNQRYQELMANPQTAQAMRLYGYHPMDIPGIPDASINALKQHPDKASDFDKKYGLPPGSARNMLNISNPTGGGTPTGGAPFSGGGAGAMYNTSLGPIKYNPSAGVDQWMPLVNKWAPAYGVDPQLARIIMDKESSGNPNAHNGTMNADGSWDHGLMQVNSVHNFSQQQLSDPEFNIKQGLSILAGSLKAHPGDLRAGIKGYNGSGPKADAYAADVLSKYRGR